MRRSVGERAAQFAKLVRCSMAGALLAPLAACALSGGPIDGRVLEEATHQPIAEAIVVVRWVGNQWGGVDSRTVCYHVETARTDAEGRYHIDAWSGDWLHGLVINDRYVTFDAYKAGYVRSDKDRPKPEILYLAAFKGTVEEWFGLHWGHMECFGGGESRKNLYRVFATIANDATAAAQTPEQMKRAAYLQDLATHFLVNFSKPYKNDGRGYFVNVNPEDSYRKEELLK